MQEQLNQGVSQRRRILVKTIYCIVTIAVATSTLFLQADNERSWANYADQELTLAYNAVVLLSGGHQETYDHTGFITMYLLGKYMQLKSLCDNGIILNVSQLNAASYFDTFGRLVSYSREFAAISTAALVSTVFLLLLRTGVGHIAALIVSIAYLFSSGVLVHFEQLRTEPISLILLIFSARMFSSATSAEEKSRLVAILISLTLLNLAVVNKIQVFIFCLIYFYGLMLFESRTNHPNIPGKQREMEPWSCKRADYLLSGGLFLMYFALMMIGRTRPVSILVMTAFSIAGGVLLSIQTSRSHLQGVGNFRLLLSVRYCALYTAALLGSFLILMPLSWDPLIFHQVVNPSGLALYVSHGQLSPDRIAQLLSGPLPHLVSQNHTPWIYIFSTLIAILAAKKMLVKFDIWAFIFFALAYYFIELASSVRFLAPHYKIYSEFILLLAFAYFLRLVPKSGARIAVSIAVLVGSLSVTGNDVVKQLRTSLGNERAYCTTSYVRDWHRHIDFDAFSGECAAAGLRVPGK